MFGLIHRQILLSLQRAILLAATCKTKCRKHVVQLGQGRLEAWPEICMVFSIQVVPEGACARQTHKQCQSRKHGRVKSNVRVISMTDVVGGSRLLVHTCAHGAWRHYSGSMCWDAGSVRC